jgi:3'-phosphoadenosine 5'-phosphosulfate sulfotransferase (PAPS reductase)/FAD synthetase
MRLFDPDGAPPPLAPYDPQRNLPDLSRYDIIALSTSGGKDSQALLDLVVELAQNAGVRDRLVAIHADLGDRVEWPGTAELAEEQAARYGLRFVKVARRGEGDLLDRIRARGKFPDAARRFCTSDFKTNPIHTAFTALVSELRESPSWRGGPANLLNAMGMRAAESPKRARRSPYARNTRASNGRRRVDDWLPLFHWSEGEVWQRVRAAGTPVSPVYALGLGRHSCTFCVLASRKDLVRAAQLRPRLAEEYARVEAESGHRFRNDLPMAEIIAQAGSEQAAVGRPGHRR